MINQETVTFQEFKAWLTGMIVGKSGELPDVDDWKMIKDMIDKVVPEKETVNVPQPYRVDEPYRLADPIAPYRQEWSPNTVPQTPQIWYTNDSNIEVTLDTTLQNGEGCGSLLNVTTSLGADGGDIQLELDLGDALQDMINIAENNGNS